jgi:hypothetical protein
MVPRLAVAAVFLALVATPSVAHEKFKIVGSVVKVHAEQIDVKALDGATYEIDFLDGVPVTRKHKKVARTELRVGAKVIVNALGHDMFDLEAVEVQLVD